MKADYPTVIRVRVTTIYNKDHLQLGLVPNSDKGIFLCGLGSVSNFCKGQEFNIIIK